MATNSSNRTTAVPTVLYVSAGLAGWLIPGAGHWMLGFRVRALVIGATVLGLFWFGEAVVADHMAVSKEVHPFFYPCQMGNGLSTIVAQRFWGEPRYAMGNERPDHKLPRGYHVGILFTTVSGLLNILAVLHVLDPRTWQQVSVTPLSEAASG